MEIYLIRHTSPAIESGICYGQADIPLAQSAPEEIKAVTRRIKEPLVGVFSSPLKRCTKLANALSTNPTMDGRLRELHFGEWENKKWDDISPDTLESWMKNYTTIGPPGGESYVQLQKRVVEVFKGILSQNMQAIAIVTHAGPIRAVLSYLLNIPLEDTFKIKVDYGSISKLSINGDQQMVDYINLGDGNPAL